MRSHAVGVEPLEGRLAPSGLDPWAFSNAVDSDLSWQMLKFGSMVRTHQATLIQLTVHIQAFAVVKVGIAGVK